MDSGFLNKNGISILEVTAILLIIAVISSVVIPSYVNRINQAKYENTVNELTAIAQASIDYFNLEGAWPDPSKGINQLVPKFMTHAVTFSPFGTRYQSPTYSNNIVTVSVLIPTGIAQNDPLGSFGVVSHEGNQDKIEITQTIPNEFTSRLRYGLNKPN